MDEVRERVNYLREKLKPHKRIKLRWHMPEMSFLEGIFSRGDRRLAPVVERAAAKGALFASWIDHMKLEPWLEAMAEEGLDPMEFLAARDLDGPLPWDHLHPGVRKSFLLTERRRAVEERLTPDCRYHACRNCGVCNIDGRQTELEQQGKDMDIRPRVIFEHRDQCDATEESNTHATTAPEAQPAQPEPQAEAATPVEEAPAKPVNPRAKPKPPSLGERTGAVCLAGGDAGDAGACASPRPHSRELFAGLPPLAAHVLRHGAARWGGERAGVVQPLPARSHAH
jgi:hypothetical protein